VPEYAAHVSRGRTSFRPVEIADALRRGARTTRACHIDAFSGDAVAGPTHLRVFANVNPEGRPRSWRIGDSFSDVARRFAPAAAHCRFPAPARC